MKTKLLTTLIASLTVTTFLNSCIGPEDDDGGTKKPTKVTELTIPGNFNWKNAMDVSCNFTSDRDSRVYVSTSEAAQPFASFVVSADGEHVILCIPSCTKEIFVRYETETGISPATKLPVNGTSVAYKVPADSKEYVQSEPETMGVMAMTKSQSYPVIGIPSSGWGTMMFEDLWPSYGDYDFNDLVINYKIQLYPNNKNMVREMLVGVRVNAIGGSLPYELFLQIASAQGGQINEVSFVDGQNLNEGVEMKLLNGTSNSNKEPALFEFKNIKTPPKAGAKYWNTEPGFETGEGKLLMAYFYIEFRNSIPAKLFTSDSFDFFIAADNEDKQTKKEIHVGNAKPALFGEDNYHRIRESSHNANKSSKYFDSNDNLIWALNIPADIDHAYETMDFLKTYPDFAAWAQSGGTQNKDWYKNKVAGTYVQ